MATYAHFLGRSVTVSYRVGDFFLPASGTLVGDSGRSIFLEQHLEQRGRVNYFRWEIPYQNIHRIARVLNEHEIEQPEPASAVEEAASESANRPSARAASASGSASPLFPQSPKTA